MPTYQYACTNDECGNRFEQVQAFTDPSVSECPVCGQRVRKVYGSVGVVFKGSGFYRNDSREGSKTPGGESKTGAESGSSTETKAADSGSTKTDGGAKPAAASPSSSDSGTKSSSTDSSSKSSSAPSSKPSSSPAKT